MNKTLFPVLIDGRWQAAVDPVGSLQAVDPSTKTQLDDHYPVSGPSDLLAVIEAAQRAVVELRAIDPVQIAHFLEIYAAAIEQRADALVTMAHLETGLPAETRLRANELPRTTNQLRQAAAAVKDRSWCRATIDTKNNIRSKLAPLGGAVAVFGPNNFPYAFNAVAGGDFAAAVAAGNPVIAKANPGHPGTTRLLAEAALQAIQESGLPAGMVQLLYHFNPDVGEMLVSHPLLGATAFTGSKNAGLRLKAAADKAGKLIYVEMSSINPVFVLPGALAERGDTMAAEYSVSLLLGTGQFCTNPGLVVLLESASSRRFIEQVKEKLQASPVGVLLGENGPVHLKASIETLVEGGAQVLTGGQEVTGAGFCFQNSLLAVVGDVFMQHPATLQTEAFGPAALCVVAADEDQLLAIASDLQGNLTGTIYSDTQASDDALYDRLAPVLRGKVGRLLNDKMPTGVTVSPAMNHGGPYPSTGHPGFTAVGIPAALLRFAALHCYDNVRPHRLPVELLNQNPTEPMWRYIDGEWTQRDV